MSNKAIALVSGGLDSATALYWAKSEGYRIEQTVHFQYGQTHATEMASAMAICDELKIPAPTVIKLNLEFLRGSSALLPLGGVLDQMEAAKTEQDQVGQEVSATFVPGRNIIMLAMIGGLADAKEVSHIVGGWNAVDYSGYPDCRPRFM